MRAAAAGSGSPRYSRATRPPSDVIASGIEGLRDRIERFVSVGASKFVVVPLTEPEDWDRELSQVADVLLPLQRAA